MPNHQRKNQKIATMVTIAREVSKLATCPRANGGSVLTTATFHILSTGYNGAPRDLPHCTEVGCLLIDDHCARVLHAESNAILNAKHEGIGLGGSLLFATHFPCPWCARMIVQVGVKGVYYVGNVESYDESSRDVVRQFFRQAGITVTRVTMSQEKDEPAIFSEEP